MRLSIQYNTIQYKSLRVYNIVHYTALQETLTEVARGSDQYSWKASGIVTPMQKCTTSFGLNLAKLLFGATELLSISLQSKSTTCEDAQTSIDISLHFLESKRTDDAFSDLVTTVKYKKNPGRRRLVDCDEPGMPIKTPL